MPLAMNPEDPFLDALRESFSPESAKERNRKFFAEQQQQQAEKQAKSAKVESKAGVEQIKQALANASPAEVAKVSEWIDELSYADNDPSLDPEDDDEEEEEE